MKEEQTLIAMIQTAIEMKREADVRLARLIQTASEELHKTHEEILEMVGDTLEAIN